MPSGGLSMFGAGLQLQQVTPGTNQTGNARLSGTMIAKLFQTSTNNGGSREIYGLGATGNTNTTVIIGRSAFTDSDGNSAMVVIGDTAQASGAGTNAATVIGASAFITGANSQSCVTVGASSGISAAGGTYTTIVGAGSRIGGIPATSTLVGGNSAAAAGQANVWVGYAAGGSGDYNVVIGASSTAQAFSNCVVIGKSQTATYNGQTLINGMDFSNGNAPRTRVINDVNSVVTITDGVIQYSAISAARTVTLPAANAVHAGWQLSVVDMSGSASAINTITITPVGADTLVGGPTGIINAAYGGRRVMSDGVSKWNIENNW